MKEGFTSCQRIKDLLGVPVALKLNTSPRTIAVLGLEKMRSAAGSCRVAWGDAFIVGKRACGTDPGLGCPAELVHLSIKRQWATSWWTDKLS